MDVDLRRQDGHQNDVRTAGVLGNSMAMDCGRFDHIESWASPCPQGTKPIDGKRRVFAKWFYPAHLTVEYDPALPPDDEKMLEGLTPYDNLYTDDTPTVDFLERLVPVFELWKKAGTWDYLHPWMETVLPWETAADYIRGRIAELVDDPDTAALLSPDTIVGCKRLCVDTDYYATYNRPNVRLVDVSRSLIETLTPRGLRACGEDFEVDAIVFATGFDAMTGALFSGDIRGRGGQPLRDKWLGGPRTYLGLTTEGFPNLFTITGPGSPSVLTNMLPSIEQHVEWIAECLAYLRARGLTTLTERVHLLTRTA